MINSNSPWLIDSGSFRTITPFRQDFETYQLVAGAIEVKALGGQKLKVVGYGTVRIPSNLDGNKEDLILTDTLHIPDSDSRLISVAKVTTTNFKILFDESRCTIFNASHKAIMMVERDSSSNQYGLNAQAIGQSQQVLAVSSSPRKCSLLELHSIMGHAHPFVLRRMISQGQLPNFQVENIDMHIICEDCIKGKSTKQIHETKASRPAVSIGHIVSADLIDLREVPCVGHYKFISVIVDHYTYYTSVKPLKEKSAEEVINHLKEFNALLRSVTGNDIRIFCSDAGNEYKNIILTSFARDKSIRLELGTPHEPRDNGFV